MEITFVKNDKLFGKEGAYVSEFQITSDFNLHVERKKGGRFLVYQKTVENGEYDIVDGLGTQSHKDVIDIDMSALVYPKYIRVVSESEVTYAEVVTDGEVVMSGDIETLDFFYFNNGTTRETYCKINELETLDGVLDHGTFRVTKGEGYIKVGHPLNQLTSRMKVHGYVMERAEGDGDYIVKYPETMIDDTSSVYSSFVSVRDEVGTQKTYTLASGMKVILEKIEES